jgi:[ribosomal protein S5]-alanine N-acetyltransferase
MCPSHDSKRPETAPPDGRGAAYRQGTHVLIRRPLAEDGEDMVRLARASRSLHHPWIHPPLDAAGWATYLLTLRADRRIGLLVERCSDRARVGIINLSEISRGGFQNACLSYYVMAPHARCGYMTEALQLAIRHAFDDLGLHRLEANIQPSNKPSMALVRRCGFRHEGFSPRFLMIAGEWRDHERFALLADE